MMFIERGMVRSRRYRERIAARFYFVFGAWPSKRDSRVVQCSYSFHVFDKWCPQSVSVPSYDDIDSKLMHRPQGGIYSSIHRVVINQTGQNEIELPLDRSIWNSKVF